MHGLLSLQSIHDSAWHAPPVHLSHEQKVPLSHGVPSGAGELVHAPVPGSHESTVQALESSHFGEPTHLPPRQYELVHGSPSSHAA